MKTSISNRGWVLVSVINGVSIWRIHDKVLNRRAVLAMKA